MHARTLPALIVAALFAPVLAAQATILPVTTNTEAALEAAIVAANAKAFQTSATQPVVIEFASSLIGQTIALTRAMPILVVDHLTVRVAGAGPLQRVTIDGTNAPTVWRMSSHHATVRNLRFQHAGGPGSLQDVVTVMGADDLRFEFCDFDSAGANALWLKGTSNTTVNDCGFRFSPAGLVGTGGTTGLTVLRGTFVANQTAVLFDVADHVQVRECVFDNNLKAVVLQPTCRNVTFGPGNLVQQGGSQPSFTAIGAVGLRLVDNQFVDNQHSAIQLRALCAGVTLTGNTLLRNGIASAAYQMVVNDCLGLLVEGMQCRDGGGGMSFGGTRVIAINGTAPAPVAITGNGREGLLVIDCEDVGVSRATFGDNARVGNAAQCTVLGSRRFDLIASDLGNAPGPTAIGVRIAQCQDVRIGNGTSVLDHGSQGILVDESTDVVLGSWGGTLPSLTVRGRSPLQLLDCVRVDVVGTPTAPCRWTAGPTASASAVTISNCFAIDCGPHVAIDGRHTANVAVQIIGSAVARFDGLSIEGHTGLGLVATDTTSLVAQYCIVDGGAGAPAATGGGLLLNGGCHGAQLLGNLVRRQQGNGISVRDSDEVWIGPGNRAIDNGGDGFLVMDTTPGPLSSHVTLQSCVAIGRGLSTQSGLRCVKMRANITNVTATRNGAGVLLQLGTQATLVNTVSWGNTVDRNRDAASSGTWSTGMRASSAGVTGPGSWSEQNMLVGVDPQFVSAVNGDVRLAAGSAAIDSGLHATPIGAGLPCADAQLQPRIRAARVDRGAYEFASLGSNTLDLAGPWLRGPAQSTLSFTVRVSQSLAGQPFVLLLGGSGTGPGAMAPVGTTVPLVFDGLTSLLSMVPAWSTGTVDPSGTGTVTLPLTPEVAQIVPELTFVAAVSSLPIATNPVVVRFLP